MHRRYTQQPPHDMSLYHILEVSSNATSADITKAYRKLTRQWHPDKRKRRNQRKREQRQGDDADESLEDESDGDDEDEESDIQLQRIREAYEVLKDDSTRLPYHKYGLLHTNMAAFLLTGGKYGNAQPSPAQDQLLRLMGYQNHSATTTTSTAAHDDRVLFLATHLVERIRPWMEGTISTSLLADSIATECDELKHLPLGAQIIRCIGRAYRHAGQKVLRRHERSMKRRRKYGWLPQSLYAPQESLQPVYNHHHQVVEEKVRDGLRHAKHLMTAAMASGRVVLSERIITAMTPPPPPPKVGPAIEYHDGDDDDFSHLLMDGHTDFMNHDTPTQDDMKDTERRKAQTAMLQALQIEALWKISKIELDRTIQEACELILSGTYFFFPSHQVPPPPSVPPTPPTSNKKRRRRQQQDCRSDFDGWVGAAGTTIDTRAGKVRAAEALVLIGDIMVRCSKLGTAWME